MAGDEAQELAEAGLVHEAAMLSEALQERAAPASPLGGPVEERGESVPLAGSPKAGPQRGGRRAARSRGWKQTLLGCCGRGATQSPSSRRPRSPGGAQRASAGSSQSALLLSLALLGPEEAKARAEVLLAEGRDWCGVQLHKADVTAASREQLLQRQVRALELARAEDRAAADSARQGAAARCDGLRAELLEEQRQHSAALARERELGQELREERRQRAAESDSAASAAAAVAREAELQQGLDSVAAELAPAQAQAAASRGERPVELPPLPYVYDGAQLGAGAFSVVVRVRCCQGRRYAAKLTPLVTGSDCTPPAREVAAASRFPGDPHVVGLVDLCAGSAIEHLPENFLRLAQRRHAPPAGEPVAVQGDDGVRPAEVLGWQPPQAFVAFADGTEGTVPCPSVLRFSESVAVAALVQRLYDAGSLQDSVERHGPLAPADRERLLIHGARGLRALHRHGLCHWDLHDHNILAHSLESGGFMFAVADLGACKPLSEEGMKRDAWGLALCGAVSYGMYISGEEPTPADAHRWVDGTRMFYRGRHLLGKVRSYLPEGELAATVIVDLLHRALHCEGELSEGVPEAAADLFQAIDRLGPLPSLAVEEVWQDVESHLEEA
eukprot:TRINITY_DN25218_c0_g1_i2.p1 TRINITY_DN25218_c0_g1~~TRINITY_DN25218_c0_g1_i2.p1  ORF type:complete len:643 (+),score=131.98 TRINITY_DN25218_c0_g1_i2:89-1930(+)